MDTQPTPQLTGAETSPLGAKPEELKNIQAGEAPRPEAAPAPANPPQSMPTSQGAGKLSAADVAAAIAAVPTPTIPASAMPTTPPVADDVDVIEPEWVEKAEEVVAAHQGDPYGEEEAVEQLQRDYLQKRYGHDVANPNSDSGKREGA